MYPGDQTSGPPDLQTSRSPDPQIPRSSDPQTLRSWDPDPRTLEITGLETLLGHWITIEIGGYPLYLHPPLVAHVNIQVLGYIIHRCSSYFGEVSDGSQNTPFGPILDPF